MKIEDKKHWIRWIISLVFAFLLTTFFTENAYKIAVLAGVIYVFICHSNQIVNERDEDDASG